MGTTPRQASLHSLRALFSPNPLLDYPHFALPVDVHHTTRTDNNLHRRSTTRHHCKHGHIRRHTTRTAHHSNCHKHKTAHHSKTRNIHRHEVSYHNNPRARLQPPTQTRAQTPTQQYGTSNPANTRTSYLPTSLNDAGVTPLTQRMWLSGVVLGAFLVNL